MRRLAVSIGLAMLAGGCGARDGREPFVDSRIPPGLETRFYPPEGWAWGLIQVGKAPPARYGVSAPAGAPKGQVLILTDYGEPAEVWFETARDLNRRDLVVWVLEPAGQGGSGRYGGRRDVGRSKGFAPDVAAVQVMARRVIRETPLTVVAHGTSAPTALTAFEGAAPGAVLVLESPRFSDGHQIGKALWMRRLGLGGLRVGRDAWRREGPDDRRLGLSDHPRRGALRLAWQTANPDLRMGGPSWDWRLAFDEASLQAKQGLGRIRAHVLITVPAARVSEARLCQSMASCRVKALPGLPALHLSGESARNAWLDAVASAAPAPPRQSFQPSAPRTRVPAHE